MNYMEQCAAAVQDQDGTYRRCARQNSEKAGATVPLCHQHYRAAFRQIAKPVADKLERERMRAARHHCNAERAVAEYIEAQAEAHTTVRELRKEQTYTYFMRCGRFVKIGASMSPAGRLQAIRRTGGVLAPTGLDLSQTELVGTEPGGFEREWRLHIKFSHLRHTGEWFTEAQELTEYIESLSERKAA